ncbi:hypothetical protein [Paenibacillus sp. R14(2021)]|uniref:hypothetical protein n=1 Tax=Paenibacillus sp. R14(2021) TaxID=2859228 RepID=UPI001C61310B|nr:hypothetical protein [Paenibacillus sp. R14(2021)]
MNNETDWRSLPIAAEQRLDELLDVWAAQARLKPERGEAIFEHFFVIEKDLGYEWWKQLFDGISFHPAKMFSKFVFTQA